ncbi:unnamed protein product [Dicrocoelium dendriticum]|nr:unnamed protein product [Dicrocoelium dendriticum]
MDSRVRLRQWLECRLNEGRIEGLRWIDKEKGIFKIPWKHHGKHSWTEHDAAIFKDWAVVTGRYRAGVDEPDWPMWKTRLRCALNKAPDIQEVKQRHDLHCDQPFKVYRFISRTESLWRANAARNACMIFDGVTPTYNPNFPPTPVSQLGSYEMATPSIPLGSRRTAVIVQRFPCVNTRTVTLVQPRNDRLFLRRVPVIPYQSEFHNNRQEPCALRIVASRSLNVRPTGTNHPNFKSAHSDYLSRNASERSSNDVTSNNRFGIALSSRPSSCCGDLDPADPLLGVTEPEFHQLGIRIQHLNFRIKDTIVTNPNGCCVYFGRYDQISSLASPDPVEVQIPHHVSEANKEFVDLLLENMIRGVILSVIQGSVYAERVCKCAVFVYAPVCTGEYVLLKKLGRRERDLIFDYGEFVSHLRSYRAGQHPKPHFEVILAFGQQLRPGSTTNSLLVWCRVASCRAWFQLNKHQSVDLDTQGLLREDLMSAGDLLQERDTPDSDYSYDHLPLHFMNRSDLMVHNRSGPHSTDYPSIPSDGKSTCTDHKTSSGVALAVSLERDLTHEEQVIEEAVEVPLDSDESMKYESSPLAIQDCLMTSDPVVCAPNDMCLPGSPVADGLLLSGSRSPKVKQTSPF